MFDKNIVKKSLSKYIYYLGIILITFIRLTQDSSLCNWNEKFIFVIKLIAAGCFGLKILMQKYTKKEGIISILLIAFGIICVAITKIQMVLLTIILLIGMKDVDLRKVIKIIFYESIVIVSIHAITYSCNWLYNKDSIKVLLTKDLNKRHYIYFSHPNIFAGIVFGITLEWIYLYGMKIRKIYKYPVILIIAIIIYKTTISRTTLLLFGLLAIGLLAVDLNKKIINIVIQKFASYAFIVISIITVLFFYFYNSDSQNNFINKIDELLSGRITLGLIARDTYGIGAFPQFVDFDQKVDLVYAKKLVVDNFYMRYSISYGYVSLMILSILIWNASKKSNSLEQLYLIIFAAWGITEGVIFDISICIVLLIVADKLLNKGQDEKIRPQEEEKILNG